MLTTLVTQYPILAYVFLVLGFLFDHKTRGNKLV